ncbi:MAG: hypothetical protein K2M89_03965 [Clostridiales bacterium]|nr:hypothetical protein [Clostridiales bacterium]
MKDNHLNSAKEVIMDWFRDRKARIEHAMDDNDIIRLHIKQSNPKVADCFVDALKELLADGLIEFKKGIMGDVYALTQAGYDFIYDGADSDYLEQAKEVIMDLFRDRKSRVGDVITSHEIIRLQNSHEPKVIDNLPKAFDSLVDSGLIELSNCLMGECYRLTQDGFDFIY